MCGGRRLSGFGGPEAGRKSIGFSMVFTAPLTVTLTSSPGGAPICLIGTAVPHSNQQEHTARPSF